MTEECQERACQGEEQGRFLELGTLGAEPRPM